MLHIFGYLKRSWKSVVLIFMLLIFQASCDLTLPQFTSNLVDIGIQQNGIAHAAPAEMRDTTMEDLSLFLTDEEQALVSSCYEQSGDRWVRTTDDEKTLEQLDEAMSMPMVMLDTIQSSDQIDRDALYARLESGEITREHLLGAESQMESQLSGMGGSTITQKAILFTQKEYEALGYDLHEMQMNYLLTTGGKMLALSLGMVAAAILVGLIASRTAAELAMHLRESLFTRVVSFGNEEMTKFSTASLITRSTNDIQQVQMVIVMLLRIVLYAPILGVGGIFRVMRTETSMAWIIAVAVGAVMCLVAVLMGVALPRFKKMQTLIDNLNLVAREILTGLPVIRAFSRETHEEERFDGANIALTRTQLFTNRVMTFMMPCMMLIMNVVTVAIVWFGAHGVDLRQHAGR